MEAKDLMKKDISVLGKGKSDPYAIINVGAQEFRTQTIDNNVNPKWDYWCEVRISGTILSEIPSGVPTACCVASCSLLLLSIDCCMLQFVTTHKSTNSCVVCCFAFWLFPF